jgi:hypothetical protein
MFLGLELQLIVLLSLHIIALLSLHIGHEPRELIVTSNKTDNEKYNR